MKTYNNLIGFPAPNY